MRAISLTMAVHMRQSWLRGRQFSTNGVHHILGTLQQQRLAGSVHQTISSSTSRGFTTSRSLATEAEEDTGETRMSLVDSLRMNHGVPGSDLGDPEALEHSQFVWDLRKKVEKEEISYSEAMSKMEEKYKSRTKDVKPFQQKPRIRAALRDLHICDLHNARTEFMVKERIEHHLRLAKAMEFPYVIFIHGTGQYHFEGTLRKRVANELAKTGLEFQEGHPAASGTKVYLRKAEKDTESK